MNQKGGAGKTTLSTNVARYFHMKGESVLFVDADPQGSARDWHAAGETPVINMIALDRPTLPKDIKEFSDKYDWIFIDSPGEIKEMAAAVLKCSDIALIPVQPSPYDIWATADTIELIKKRQDITDGKLKAAFIISRQIHNTTVSKEVKEALDAHQLPIFQNRTSQRVSYVTSAAMGRTVLDNVPNTDAAAVNEIQSIAEELREFVK